MSVNIEQHLGRGPTTRVLEPLQIRVSGHVQACKGVSKIVSGHAAAGTERFAHDLGKDAATEILIFERGPSGARKDERIVTKQIRPVLAENGPEAR